MRYEEIKEGMKGTNLRDPGSRFTVTHAETQDEQTMIVWQVECGDDTHSQREGSPLDPKRMEFSKLLMMELEVIVPIFKKMPENLAKARVGLRIAAIGDYLEGERKLVDEIIAQDFRDTEEIKREMGLTHFRHPNCPNGMEYCGNITFVEDFSGTYYMVKGFVEAFLIQEQVARDKEMRDVERRLATYDKSAPRILCENMRVLILKPEDFNKCKEPSLQTISYTNREAMDADLVLSVADDGVTAKILKKRWA